MIDLPKLNLPEAKLRIRENQNEAQIWDNIRCMWLMLTPEEWVRQQFIAYLINHCAVPSALIKQEHVVLLNGTQQRADIVVFDSLAKPRIVVECKAANVPISQDVFAQVVRYNSVICAQVVAITNGLNHFFARRDSSGKYCAVSAKEVFED